MIESLFYFIVVIGVLVFVHELGHFLAAKAFGMKVEVFSLGMGPRAFGFEHKETDYRVSWLPLGGYVKISGMIDESMDTEFVGQEPQSWEYRSKPRWQRMIVISAGVIMNILIAGVIYSYLNFTKGQALAVYDPEQPVYVEENSPAFKMGLRTGDRLVSVNDKPIVYWNDFLADIEHLSSPDYRITANRDGRQQTFKIYDNFLSEMNDHKFGIQIVQAPIIGEIAPGSAAEKHGLKAGDKILEIDGRKISFFPEIPAYLRSEKKDTISLTWERNRQSFTELMVLKNYQIGIVAKGPEVIYVQYSLGESITSGFGEIGTNLVAILNGIGRLFQGKEDVSQAIGGPIKIAQISGKVGQMGLDPLLALMAILSLNLALLNILPIPALDGGHLMVLIIETVARRDLPEKIKMGIQQVGFALLITLMIFAVFNDVRNLF